ncbi:hypothetical protein PPL_06774 [Heterostelium album PN500]|uniref:Uncharacterized protein n=1 Tax=Heterostelium pallidum (strain ATCC 26659 / Pp 5 / PN500) TaxID=670386 RepID=D3BFN9_HETP5|nr:hypothetical protein PPL_06774 [Heterostelium album PN500]EFA79953.1 hypothetical protein PPL_06774 [Heterostelium album PN500]|eukprot:XP_020432073.1 hypothetical protein PPL_06774 [Heterostelium album PN500]
MGQSLSNNSLQSNYNIEVVNSNQTILPDLIWRSIIELLSYDQCRNHRHDFNVLSLSLISHYWLVNIVAKSSPKITTLDNKCKFLINYPKSFQRSQKKLNNNNNNNKTTITNNNDNKEENKFNIGKLTLKFGRKNNTKISNSGQWFDNYNNALATNWSLDSLTFVDSPYSLPLIKLSVARQLRKLRVYSADLHNPIIWSEFPKLEKMIDASVSHPGEEPQSFLAGLTNLRHLSITNENRSDDRDRELNILLMMEYTMSENITSKVFMKDITSIGHQLETIKLKGKYTLTCQLFSVIGQLVNLKRLSLTEALDVGHVNQLVKLTDLVRLSAKFNEHRSDENALHHFLRNNQSVRHLKVRELTDIGKRDRQTLLIDLLEQASPILEEVRLIIDQSLKSTAPPTSYSNINQTVTFITDSQQQQQKQPKQKTIL